VKYVRVQRIISLRIAKAYRTVSHEALCILTGITPIHINAQEIATRYNITTGRSTQKYQIDEAENPSNWLHPVDIVSVNDIKDGDEHCWNIFTDGSKSKQELGSGVGVFTGKVLAEQLKFKLDDRCSNNQAEQLTVVEALEVL
jgi:hypothetical protein